MEQKLRVEISTLDHTLWPRGLVSLSVRITNVSREPVEVLEYWPRSPMLWLYPCVRKVTGDGDGFLPSHVLDPYPRRTQGFEKRWVTLGPKATLEAMVPILANWCYGAERLVFE